MLIKPSNTSDGNCNSCLGFCLNENLGLLKKSKVHQMLDYREITFKAVRPKYLQEVNILFVSPSVDIIVALPSADFSCENFP